MGIPPPVTKGWVWCRYGCGSLKIYPWVTHAHHPGRGVWVYQVRPLLFSFFLPPNSWITGTRRATPPCHPHLGPFRTNWEGKPFVLRFVGWFRTDEKESLLLIVHVGAGLNQQEGKPFLLRFVGLLRRGNPSRHPYLFRPVWTNGEGFPSLLGFWGHFEQRRGNPSCCPRFEPTGCVLLGHFGMPTIYFFFFSC